VIPREGEIAIVTPFRRTSVRESLRVPAEVRVWNEDENPLATVAGILRDRKVMAPVAVEETVRFFAVDGLRRVMPSVDIVNGASVVRACRMVKSPAELALMQKAADITIAAYRHTAPRIKAGMTPKDIGATMDSAHERSAPHPNSR
jgi:Xaa-Pro dipeptidase